VRPDLPLVSVLLPARDAAATIGAALESVSRQTLTDLECVIVDDGSRDETAAKAERMARRDRRFRLLSQPARGIVAALGAGLAECRGRYVARMDADDLMHRERLRLQVEWLERHPEAAGVGSHVRIFPRRGLRRGFRAYERWLASLADESDIRANAFVECPVVHPTLVLRADLLRTFGYRDAPWPEDYDLVLRLLEAGHGLGVVPRRLLGWRDRNGRLTRTDERCRPERIVACKAAFLARGLLSRCERYVLWGYGPTARALRRALLRHGRRPAFVVEIHPRRIGERIHGAAVVAPEALPDLPRLPLVAAVAGAEARARIRAHLHALGRRETVDYLCAA